jgi:predicted ATPase/transcriptional regulator with XRE-family HTH domain
LDDVLSLGIWISRRRKALGLTQRQMAEQVHCSLQTVKAIETDARRPSAQMAERLADVLQLTSALRDGFLRAARKDLAVAQLPPPVALETDGARADGVAHVQHIALKPGALPSQPNRLIGRTREIAAVIGLLRSDARLVTLVGPPGVGKTRLAHAVAERLRAAFPDGVRFTALAAVQEAPLVGATLCAALGLKLQVNQAPAALLETALHARYILLVLDNFEQILDAAPLLAELLAACPNLHILVTSREPLRLRAEHVFQTPPLDMPPLMDDSKISWNNGRHTTETQRPSTTEDQRSVAIGQSSAVQLFVARARAAKYTFALTPDNASAVAAICRRLDGLPLAIELAAARVAAIDLTALLAQIESAALHVLTDGARDLPDHQRTLRSALSWSYDQLDTNDKALLRALSVFVGGWASEAATIGAVEADAVDVLMRLTRLASKSLVAPLPSAGGEARFGLLETIRAFALEQLRAAGEERVMRQRHAAYVTAVCERAEPLLRGPDQQRWLERLAAEQPNVRAVLTWLQQHDPLAALRLAAAAAPYWDQAGMLVEGTALLRATLAVAKDAPPPLRARSHLWLGRLFYHQSDLATARKHCETSAQLAREEGDECGEGWALYALACTERARPADAVPTLRSSLALLRAANDRIGIAAALNALGGFERWAGNYDAALQHHNEALSLARAEDDVTGAAETLHSLGMVLIQIGDYAGARLRFAEGETLLRAINERLELAWIIHHQGYAASCQGDFYAAAALFAESSARLAELNDRAGTAWATYNRGELAQRRGNMAASGALLEEALARFQELDDAWGVAWSQTLLAWIACERGDTRAARCLLHEAAPRHRQAGSQHGISVCLDTYAVVALAEDQPERAAQLLSAAASLRERIAAVLPPADLPPHQRLLGSLRAQLGDECFEQSWRAGQEMRVDDLLADLV